MELESRVRCNNQAVSQDGVPILYVRTMKCKGASKEAFGSSEVGFFGRRAAEEEELVRCVHELQLSGYW
uniref:Uncharacterized protein n=1 Tax=Anguilla anguilla TaxID=7936 RepID=A0A0E9XDY9_ANGAN